MEHVHFPCIVRLLDVLYSQGNQNSYFNGSISNGGRFICANTHNVLFYVMDSWIVVPRCCSIVICINIQYSWIAFIAKTCNNMLPCNLLNKSQCKCMIIRGKSLHQNQSPKRTNDYRWRVTESFFLFLEMFFFFFSLWNLCIDLSQAEIWMSVIGDKTNFWGNT